LKPASFTILLSRLVTAIFPWRIDQRTLRHLKPPVRALDRLGRLDLSPLRRGPEVTQALRAAARSFGRGCADRPLPLPSPGSARGNCKKPLLPEPRGPIGKGEKTLPEIASEQRAGFSACLRAPWGMRS
jgi:hypothetical protein